ncbi:MAG: HEAT repeat domain-containing protein [bacterium]
MKRLRHHPIRLGLLMLLAVGQLAFASDDPKPAAKAAWQWQKTPAPLALVANGLWWESFHVDAALDKAGTRQRKEFKNLSQYSVIVLVNAQVFRLPKGAVDEIREFVNQGGGLVVLGGLCAYNNGGYAGTALEEILPVSLKESYIDFYITAANGAKLTKGEQADWPLRIDFLAGPTAWYFHTLQPKAGAKVQVKVGNQPALVSGTFGQGRVVACALAVNGNPTAGVTPFWEWKDWPALLGRAIDCAAGARPAGVAADPALKPLTVAELQLPFPKALAKRAAAVPDEPTATALFNLAVPGSNAPAKCSLAAVLPAILPYAKAGWAARLTNLTAAANGNIETRKAALTLLGACHDPTAVALLTKALADKKTELAAVDGLGWLGQADAISVLENRFAEALKSAQLPDGPDRWEPLAFADASPLAAHAAIALYRLGEPEAVARLCSLFRDINLYDQILWNGAYRSTPARLRAEILDQSWEFIMDNVVPIPAVQGAAFVQSAATVEDPVVIEFLAGALEKSAGNLPKADWKSLVKAKSGIIVKMSKAINDSNK